MFIDLLSEPTQIGFAANVDGLLLGWHLKNVELGYRALLKK